MTEAEIRLIDIHTKWYGRGSDASLRRVRFWISNLRKHRLAAEQERERVAA